MTKLTKQKIIISIAIFIQKNDTSHYYKMTVQVNFVQAKYSRLLYHWKMNFVPLETETGKSRGKRVLWKGNFFSENFNFTNSTFVIMWPIPFQNIIWKMVTHFAYMNKC